MLRKAGRVYSNHCAFKYHVIETNVLHANLFTRHQRMVITITVVCVCIPLVSLYDEITFPFLNNILLNQ
jgi:hypothetical protein